MNRMKAVWPTVAAILASGAAGITHAQMPAGGPPGWNAAMTRLFGDVKAFSAKAEMRALDKFGQPAIQVPMNFALLDSKIRMHQLMMAIAQKQNQKASPGGKK